MNDRTIPHPTDAEDCRDDQQEMQQWFAQWHAEQDYHEQQRDLPPHKRDGYAEKMAEIGDMLLDERREHDWMADDTIRGEK